MIGRRKDSHIFKAVRRESQVRGGLFGDVVLLHNALPELDFDDVSTETEFLGHKVSAPVVIGALTGGTELAGKINGALAEAAERLGVPMYVGSQRIAIERPETRWTFTVVKERAPNVPKIANLGAPQISRLEEARLLDWVNEAVEMIGASAIAVHLNPAQEVMQPEGEPWFRGVYDKLRYIKRRASVPLIVKEVGNGISREVARRLGFADGIDVGGLGGTSFVRIEGLRSLEAKNDVKYRLSLRFARWGIPTAASVCEVRSVFGGLVIASGGIHNGVVGAKAIALGADFFASSRGFLKAAMRGRAPEKIAETIEELKTAMFLTGSRTVQDLRTCPRAYMGRLREWLEARGLKC